MIQSIAWRRDEAAPAVPSPPMWWSEFEVLMADGEFERATLNLETWSSNGPRCWPRESKPVSFLKWIRTGGRLTRNPWLRDLLPLLEARSA